MGNFDISPPNSYNPAYCSEYVTSISNASSAEFNVFDDGNYGAFTHTSLVSATGITFDHAAGTFTVAAAGKYWLDVLLDATDSWAGGEVTYRVKVDGATVYSSDFFLNSGDRSHTIFLILDLTAGQAVSVTIENTAASNVTVNPGTALSLERVA